MLTELSQRYNWSDQWVVPSAPFGANDLIKDNRNTVYDFIKQQIWTENKGHINRTKEQIHLENEEINLSEILETLLIPLRYSDNQTSEQHQTLICHLSDIAAENIEETVAIYQISPSFTRRRRMTASGNGIAALQQGPNPVRNGFGKGDIYPGDAEIKVEDQISVQIHILNIDRGVNTSVVYHDLPVVTVWIPERLKLEKYVQS